MTTVTRAVWTAAGGKALGSSGRPAPHPIRPTKRQPDIRRPLQIRMASPTSMMSSSTGQHPKLEPYLALSIAAGNGSGVIPRLFRHVGEHPLRERGVALLMSALHDEGRTHDAHAVYARLVRWLGEGLAVGPGREVRRTLDAILDGASPAPGTRVDALSDTGMGTRS